MISSSTSANAEARAAIGGVRRPCSPRSRDRSPKCVARAARTCQRPGPSCRDLHGYAAVLSRQTQHSQCEC
eukprot:661419-Prymnesium_polylepis.1